MPVCTCWSNLAGSTFVVTKSPLQPAFAIITCSTAAASELNRPGPQGPQQANSACRRLTNICHDQPQMMLNL